MKTLRRWILAMVLAVLAAGALAHFLNADRFRPYIQAALESGLNRHVEILGPVHLNLFTGPGFTVERVSIGDDPAAGIEPFAYVESMRARVRITSLLAGKLAFSSLHLDSPSVNVVKMQSGPWNIQPLLDPPSSTKLIRGHTIPDIQISGGRLNFKFGDTKSVFYIKDADVDVYPNQSGQLVVRFSGLPARSDRGAQTFGEISARGLLRFGAGGVGDQISMGLRLERTSMSELVRLFNARDMGVHGFAIAEAQLSGPLDKIDVSGSLNINDIHRWDLMPSHGEGWTLHYAGFLDLRDHRLNLETIATQGPPPPVSLQLGVTDYLSNARWGASIRFHNLPAASLLETARHMGVPLAPGVLVDGKINGGIAYSNPGGLGGELTLESASVKFPQAVSAAFDSARLAFTNKNVALDPVSVQLDNGQSAEIEGQYAFDSSHTSFKITTSQLTIAEIESDAGRVAQAPPIPLLENLSQGTWKGWIAFDRKDDRPGVWSGVYELRDAAMQIPGVASPVRFTSGTVEMKQNQIQMSRMRARMGAVRLEGDYRYDPDDAAKPHRLRLRIPELKLAELERLMLPTLRRRESFLARTFGRNAPLPKWLEERSVDASLQIASVLNGDSPLGQFQAHVVWEGAQMRFSDVELRLDPMRATGDISVNLTKASPVYRLAGNLENLDYRNGQLDVDGELETSGLGDGLLLNVQSEGTFEGRDIALGPDQVREISGAYRIAPASGIPRLALSNLQVAIGQDNLVGQGSSLADGRIVLELMSGRRPVRLTGMLLPVHPEH